MSGRVKENSLFSGFVQDYWQRTLAWPAGGAECSLFSKLGYLPGNVQIKLQFGHFFILNFKEKKKSFKHKEFHNVNNFSQLHASSKEK